MTSTTPEAAREAARAAKAPARTSYVILSRQNPNGGPWMEDGVVDATSADAAVKRWAATEDAAIDGAEVVAVPSRSFQPRKVRVETSTKVTLG